MALSELDKSVVRQFLSMEAAKNWLNNAKLSVPKPKKTGNITPEFYTMTLHEGEGWRNALDFLEVSVQEMVTSDSGIKPIDNTFD